MICLVFLFSIVWLDVFKIPLSNYSPQLCMDNCLKFLLAGLKEWKGNSKVFCYLFDLRAPFSTLRLLVLFCFSIFHRLTRFDLEGSKSLYPTLVLQPSTLLEIQPKIFTRRSGWVLVDRLGNVANISWTSSILICDC